MKNIEDPLDTDVLCGRDAYVQRHIGNLNYRKLVNSNKEAYIACQKTDKLKISRSIVAAIRGQQGRFLEKNKVDGTWYDIGDKKAIEKTSQALREGQPKLKRKMVERGVAYNPGSGNPEPSFQPTTDYTVSSSTTTTAAAATPNPAPMKTMTSITENPASPEASIPSANISNYSGIPRPPHLHATNEHAVNEAPAPNFELDHLKPQSLDGVPCAAPVVRSQNFVDIQQELLMDRLTLNVAPENTDALNSMTSRVDATPRQLHSQQSVAQGSVNSDFAHCSEFSQGISYAPAGMDPIAPHHHHHQAQKQYPPRPMHPFNYQQQQHIQQRDGDRNRYASSSYFNHQQQMQQRDAERNRYSSSPSFNHQQQIQQRDGERNRYTSSPSFLPPTPTRSSDSLSSCSLVDASHPSEGSNQSTAGRKIDRRRLFAKMKVSRTPSGRMESMSSRSLDGMPDIHMVDSQFSLLSNVSAGNSVKQGGTAGRTAGFRDDHGLTLESRRSLMSGLSKISDSSDIHSIFSDLSKKIGNVSMRSIPMSEISGVEEGYQEGLEEIFNWDLKPTAEGSMEFER